MSCAAAFALLAAAIAPSPGTAQPVEAAPKERSDDRVVCKRFVKTGTLASRERECLTQREWKRFRDQLWEMRGGSAGCGDASRGPFCGK